MPQTREVDQVGKRQDLSNIIAVADAKNTPVISMLPKGKKIENMMFSWQADGYDAPKTTGVPEGKDVSETEDAAKNRREIYGRAQRWWRVPKVTTEAETVSVVAGVPSEMARAKTKKTVEIKRDMEATSVSDNDSQPGNGGEIASQMRGFGKWIQNGAQGDLPVDVLYRTPTTSIFTGNLSAFTEDVFSGLLQSRYNETGHADELIGIFGTDLKRAVSNMSRWDVDKAGYGHVRMFNNTASEGTLYNKIDIFESDFGLVKIMPPHSFLPNTGRGYILDLDMVEIRPHTNPNSRDLENRGGGPTALIDAIASMVVKNPLAHCKIDATPGA